MSTNSSQKYGLFFEVLPKVPGSIEVDVRDMVDSGEMIVTEIVFFTPSESGSGINRISDNSGSSINRISNDVPTNPDKISGTEIEETTKESLRFVSNRESVRLLKESITGSGLP